MRTIKFRAWDKGTNHVREVTNINWYDEYIWVDETPMSGDKLPIDETPLMQFTGLLDCQGKEIYEGDIVKWGNHCDWCKENPIRIAEVKLNPDILFASQVGDFHYGNFAYKDTDKHLEVIGNIYENGDLLK